MTTAHDIPVAHTPPGGYGTSFPPLVLAGCTEPLVAGAPDLRGIWRTVSATRGGEPVPADDRLMSFGTAAAPNPLTSVRRSVKPHADSTAVPRLRPAIVWP